MQNESCFRWVLVTPALLAIPASPWRSHRCPDPGQGTDGVNWGPMDFATMAFSSSAAGLLFEYASSRAAERRAPAAVGIAVRAGLF